MEDTSTSSPPPRVTSLGNPRTIPPLKSNPPRVSEVSAKKAADDRPSPAFKVGDEPRKPFRESPGGGRGKADRSSSQDVRQPRGGGGRGGPRQSPGQPRPPYPSPPQAAAAASTPRPPPIIKPTPSPAASRQVKESPSPSSLPHPLIPPSDPSRVRSSSHSSGGAPQIPTFRVEKAAADWGDDEPVQEDPQQVLVRLRMQLDKLKVENASLRTKETELASSLKTVTAAHDKTKTELSEARTKAETLEAVQRSLGENRAKLEDERDQLKVALARAEKSLQPKQQQQQQPPPPPPSPQQQPPDDALLRKALKDAETKIQTLQAEIEFINADKELKLLEAASELRRKDELLASYNAIPAAPLIFSARAEDRELAVNLLEFSKLDVTVVETGQWGIMGEQAVDLNLRTVLMERNAESVPALFNTPGMAALFFVPARQPEADADKWARALAAFCTAVSGKGCAKVAVVVEEPLVRAVGPHAVQPLIKS